jgi:hypothetical protein
MECGDEVVRECRRCLVEKPNHRHRRVLRARRARPCHRRTAEQDDEIAPSYT